MWEGQDYLPRVLNDWFNDPHDGFYVATLRDRFAGVIKLTRFGPEEWWLEGLRVDPEFQGQGISRILHHFAINQLRRQGEGVIRFSTSSNNEAVRKLAQETGFRRVAAYAPYGADALAEPVETLRQLGPADAGRVRAWLDASSHFIEAQRSLETSWRFFTLTDARLAERLEAGLVYGWPENGVAIINAVAESHDDDPVLKIAYLDVPDIAAAARDLRRLAASLARARVRIKAFKHAARFAALEQAGYTQEWDGELWLYARDVSLTLHAHIRSETPPPTAN